MNYGHHTNEEKETDTGELLRRRHTEKLTTERLPWAEKHLELPAAGGNRQNGPWMLGDSEALPHPDFQPLDKGEDRLLLVVLGTLFGTPANRTQKVFEPIDA